MSRQRPVVSVIIASRNSRATVGRCLESLAAQVTDLAYEVIVVDSSEDDTAELIRGEHPDVRLETFDERKFCGDARNHGLAMARGSIVAFTDADCVVAPDWIDAIVAAHRHPALAVGGAIDNDAGANHVSWAAYFCEFSAWMPGLPPRWVDDAAGANLSYKSSAFEAFGGFIEGTYCSDSEFHWRLARAGERIRFDPAIRVTHRSLDDAAGFLRHELFHGRCFGRVRTRGQGFSNARRWLYVGLAWLIPARLLARIVSRQVRARQPLGRCLRALPLLVAGLVAWSLGEALGYAESSSVRDSPSSPRPIADA